MTPGSRDFIAESGLDPEHFQIKAAAEPFGDRPAIISGIYSGRFPAIVRAWALHDGAGWAAQAIVASHHSLVFDELEAEEAERLRAESQTPAGMDAPVGQEAVVERSDPKPYTPPVQPLDTAESVQADAQPVIDGEIVSEITVTPLPCGPECVMLDGPEGRIFDHKPPCEEA